MTKRFWYIVLLILVAPLLLYAKTDNIRTQICLNDIKTISLNINYAFQQDTTLVKGKKKSSEEDKKKIKEVARAKKMPKPEKIEDVPTKPKRQRRPEGVERPPEIPRRND
ncbi:hypothetical protein ACFQZX_18480 [Mucilaginibacter litoreus]|uniref:Uncharacterized protein n=1 Tax=Mucilaginibacter litoreus TaxID=1048221 RepID=A0ABW3AXL0_9SPHI